ncbi:hypothetical protein FQR65_LT14081 [Abscondita terminalis]|nr:hypothetical protein FQR65_LT14081 [Abscondita terminalis]
MSANTITPLNFEGNLAENWRFWVRIFKNYLKATEIDKKSQELQSAHLIGEEAYKIYTTFSFTEEEEGLLKPLIQKYTVHFMPQENLSYERYNFFTIKQGNSSIQQLVTLLKDQASKCKFGDLSEDLIKTALICAVNNNELRRKLLQSDGNSLTDIVTTCSLFESSQKQSKIIQEGKTGAGTSTEEICRIQTRNEGVAASISNGSRHGNPASTIIEDTIASKEFDEELKAQVCLKKSSINVTESKLQEIKEKTENDPQLVELKKVLLEGWNKNNKNQSNLVKVYSKYKGELTMHMI